MSIYSKNETGTRLFRSRLNLSHRKLFDCDFAKLIPFCTKFILPGDIAKIGAEAFIRYQPTVAPPLTRSWARFRWFFVPLRLVEPNAEKIITGSDNGKLIETELPTFTPILRAGTGVSAEWSKVQKYSFDDYLGMPVGDYAAMITAGNIACLPALYWLRGYQRIFFDYYRDQNLSPYSEWSDFTSHQYAGGNPASILSPALHKDYFTSALPWQLKGVAPTFAMTPSLDFSGSVQTDSITTTSSPIYLDTYKSGDAIKERGLYGVFDNEGQDTNVGRLLQSALERGKVSQVSFNMDDLRTMAAQTRVFERLARCGSRYTEYLHANFGVAPADGTLQRAQYLGGFSQPIVTTEVVQTGGDSSEVGTLRGHGISAGGNSIGVHKFKEFGMLIGLMDIMPELVYTQGINRELTYKTRFDFFNPSFQHLSEQEVRNGELYIDFSDGKNDDTFGFQQMYNELRSSRDEVVGDLRDQLSYWQQGVTFASRPQLNNAFITASNYLTDFKRPFEVLNGAMPIICDIGNQLDFWRPMVRYGTPGLVDHL